MTGRVEIFAHPVACAGPGVANIAAASAEGRHEAADFSRKGMMLPVARLGYAGPNDRIGDGGGPISEEGSVIRQIYLRKQINAIQDRPREPLLIEGYL